MKNKDIEDLFDPMKMFNKLTNIAVNSNEIMKNNIKYHKACVVYHQALCDMMEAIDDNARIMKGEK